MPKISVIMPTFNRSKFLRFSIPSILKQTYRDFEFLIFNDFSTDDTQSVLEEYASYDTRIKVFNSDRHKDYAYWLNKGLELANGDYIARMDDDDISNIKRFEKQVSYLELNRDITVIGTKIRIIGNGEAESWVEITDSDEIALAMNFFNPLCHPTIMIRNSFLLKHNIKYSINNNYAEEYLLYNDILDKGGKIANLPEALLLYRSHKQSVTQSEKSSSIQIQTVKDLRNKLLSRFYDDKKVAAKMVQKTCKYPFKINKKKVIFNILEQIKEKNLYKINSIENFTKRYIGKKSTISIFFSSDNNYFKHLYIAIYSICYNKTPFDFLDFYILDGGISFINKKLLLHLKNKFNINIHFIKISKERFINCKVTEDCPQISIATYFRYIIPELAPNLNKCLYLDCDIIVEDSLNQLWNINIDDFYAAVVEDFWDYAHYHYNSKLGIQDCFNAGVMLINNKKWRNDSISNKLFDNTEYFIKNNLLKWVDQDILNYTFSGSIKYIDPCYNVQQTAFIFTMVKFYTQNKFYNGVYNPVIIHYSGIIKPWQNDCLHKMADRYNFYLMKTIYKYQNIVNSQYLKFRESIKSLRHHNIVFVKRIINKLRDKLFGNYISSKFQYQLSLMSDNTNRILNDISDKVLMRIEKNNNSVLSLMSDNTNRILNDISDKVLMRIEKNNNSMFDELIKLYNKIDKDLLSSNHNNDIINQLYTDMLYNFHRLHYACVTQFMYESKLKLYDYNNKYLSYEREIIFDFNDAIQDSKKRYIFARNYIKYDYNVLDAGCGIGYGSKYIAEKAKNVVGIDINSYAIDFANKFFPANNLVFEVKNLDRLNKYQKFDVIVCFEMIEHVCNPLDIVSSIYDALKDEGKIICSVPNENVFKFKKENNPYHIRHFKPNELVAMLVDVGFKNIKVFFQYPQFNFEVLPFKKEEGNTIICIGEKHKCN